MPRVVVTEGLDEFPGKWNTMAIEGVMVPGKCMLPDFDRHRDMDPPKKKGSDKNRLVDNGIKPGEVTIVIQTIGDQQLHDLQDVYNRFLSPDRPFNQKNTVVVGLAPLNSRGIRVLYFYGTGAIKSRGEGASPALLHTFKARVIDDKDGQSTRPKRAKVGGLYYSTVLKAGPQSPYSRLYEAPPWAPNVARSIQTVRSPDSDAATNVASQYAQVAQNALGVDGLYAVQKNGRTQLLPPGDIRALAEATGDENASFVSRVTSSRSPSR